MQKRMFAAALAVLLPWAAPALAAPPKLETTTLKNGLKIIVQEDHSSPVVALVVGYRAGSRNEHPGIKGIAHLFEHMMFKGSKRFGPGVQIHALESVGATYNAFTREDETVYHELVPREELPRFLAMEADRMGTLQLSDAMLTSEREVVKEEYRLRIQNQPASRIYEAYLGKAYTQHPYAWTPAGTLEDLDKITLNDCLEFYRAYYSPANAVLVVVGDTTLKEVTALAEKEFGPIAKPKSPAAAVAVEPAQTQRRDLTLAMDAQLPILIGGYHVPAASDKDADALAVLSYILSEGESSRLSRALVREQRIAPFASGSLRANRDPGMFLVMAGYLPTHSAKDVEAALLAEIAKVREHGVLDSEMERVRNQIVSEKAFELLSPARRGVGIVSAEIIERDYTRFLSEVPRLEKVTKAQVQKVAQKYLVNSNLTLAVLQPKASNPAETRQP